MSIKLSNEIGPNFCYAPWTNIHINTGGTFKTCCAGTTSIGDLRTTLITDLLSDHKLIEIKKSIVNNKSDGNCDICYRQEQHSSVSERSWYKDIADNEPIDVDNVHDTKLQNLDIRWSNTCNLSCVYCDQEASSQWASLKKQPFDRLNYDNTIEDIVNFIESNKGTLKNLALLGGEPLLQKENDRLLDAIDDNVHINVITNLSVPLHNNRIFQKLISKRNVMWDISFETVEEKFEYVRHGSSWKLMLENIKYLRECIKNQPGHLIGITSQYCVYNAMSLSALHEYFIDNDLPMMRWNELHHPSLLSVSSLPQRFLNKAVNELEKSIQYHSSPNQKRFLQDMANSLKDKMSDHQNCNDLYVWHSEQEQTYWPDFKYKFAKLWPEYR
jgi:organic radical activating enzyme